MSSTTLLKTIIFILTLWTFYNHVMASNRTVRSAITPCLTCTVLNRAQCCQQHRRCCTSGSATGQSPSRQQQSRNINYQPTSQQQQLNLRQATCPARSNLISFRQSCVNRCASDADCTGGTRCCPPPVYCCRPLEPTGMCPNTVISARCCRSCVTNGGCRRQESCCPQPGHSGCCMSGCAGNARCGNGVDNTQPLPVRPNPTRNPTRDSDTVAETISVPTTDSSPPATTRNSRFVENVIYEDSHGNKQTRQQTLEVDDNGVTVTIFVNDQGVVETIHETVHETVEETVQETVITETQVVEQTITQEGPNVIIYLSVVDGVTYTVSTGTNGRETGLYTVIENGQVVTKMTIFEEHVETVYQDATIVQTDNSVFMTEDYTHTIFMDGLQKAKGDESSIDVGGDKEVSETVQVKPNGENVGRDWKSHQHGLQPSFLSVSTVETFEEATRRM